MTGTRPAGEDAPVSKDRTRCPQEVKHPLASRAFTVEINATKLARRHVFGLPEARTLPVSAQHKRRQDRGLLGLFRKHRS